MDWPSDGIGDCRYLDSDCVRSEQQSIGFGVLCVGRFWCGVRSGGDFVGIVETHHGIRRAVRYDCRRANCGGMG